MTKEYYLKHKEEIHEKNRIYRATTQGKLAVKRNFNSYKLKSPEKVKANLEVQHAVEKGFLIKPLQCSKCNLSGRIEGHHEDYSKPLEVIWLCRSCHLQLHRNKLRR